jgi:hypothetical protein
MISMDILNALCEEAGLDPTRVAKAVITPSRVTFQVYSMNIYGEKMLHRDGDRAITHYVVSRVA